MAIAILFYLAYCFKKFELEKQKKVTKYLLILLVIGLLLALAAAGRSATG